VSSPLARHSHSPPPSQRLPPSCPSLPAVVQPIRMRPPLFLFICELLQQVSFDVLRIAEHCLVAKALSWPMPAYAFCTALRYNPLHGRSFLASPSSRDGSLLWLERSSRTARIAQEGRPQLPLRPPSCAPSLPAHAHDHTRVCGACGMRCYHSNPTRPVSASPSIAGGGGVQLPGGGPSGSAPYGAWEGVPPPPGLELGPLPPHPACSCCLAACSLRARRHHYARRGARRPRRPDGLRLGRRRRRHRRHRRPLRCPPRWLSRGEQRARKAMRVRARGHVRGCYRCLVPPPLPLCCPCLAPPGSATVGVVGVCMMLQDPLEWGLS